MHQFVSQLKRCFTSVAPDGQKSLGLLVSWALLGNVCYAISQLLLIVVIAKVLTSHEVGQYALALSVTAPVFLLTQLQLRTVLTTDAGGSAQFKTYRNLRYLSSFIAVLFSLLCACTFYEGDQCYIIVMVVSAKAIESISDIYFGYLQKYEQFQTIGVSKILKGLLTTLCFSGLLISTKDLGQAVSVIPCVWAAVLFFYDRPKVAALKMREKLGIKESRDARFMNSMGLLRLAFPLGLVAMFTSLQSAIPRYFIDGVLSKSELGIFSAIGYLCVCVTLVSAAVSQGIAARLGRLWISSNFIEYKNLLKSVLMKGFLVTLIVIGFATVFGKAILSGVYGEEYSQQSFIMVILLCGTCISAHSSIFVVALQSMRLFKRLFYVSVLGFCISFLLSAILVPTFGMKGAATAILITNGAVLFSLIVTLAHIHLKYRVHNLKNHGECYVLSGSKIRGAA